MAYNNNSLSPTYLELVHGGDGKVSPVIELIEPQVRRAMKISSVLSS